MSHLSSTTKNRPPPKMKKMKKMQNVKNENHQKHVVLEGFRQNGLQIRNQRIFLRIVAPVKIDFRHFFENEISVTLES